MQLAIDRLLSCIENFLRVYVHGSKPSDEVVLKFKVAVRLLKESSPEIAPFLPEVSQQLIVECEDLDFFLNEI